MRGDCTLWEGMLAIRFPEGLQTELEAAGRASSRTLYAEIIHRLNKNGPVEAATSPSRDSAHPLQESELNTNTVSSTEPASTSPVAGRDLFKAAFDESVLDAISLRDLRQLENAIQTLADVCSALLCQPRFWDANYLTPAGWQMDCILQLLSTASDSIFDTVKLRDTIDVDDVHMRGRMALDDALRAEEDLEEIVGVAADAARKLRRARFAQTTTDAAESMSDHVAR